MKKTTIKFENLLLAFPDDREEILLSVDRAKQYRGECGCSLGAKFLIASLGIFGIYFFVFGDIDLISMLWEILLGLLFIFVATLVGKFMGIGIARIRLALLYRSLLAKYPIPGD